MEEQKDKYRYYDIVLRSLGIEVDERAVEALYDAAMLVKLKGGKANIRDTTNVATQNLSLAVIEMQVGLQTGILIASEDIKPGEIIGCSYVDSFWKNRGEPFLFQKNGKKLSNYNHDHSVKNFF